MENIKGKIHSFESFGASDGPGIRFIIFMQGCHLQCKYCQNRDTWDVNSGTLYSVEEIVEKALKYKNYFITSGGGITVSGGEPLLQADFLIELFKEFKKNGITTAIDTTGIIKITDKIKELIDLTDVFLLDIKEINDEKCKILTSQSNKLELEFAKYLSEINKPMWIRYVLVPDMTDSEEDLIKTKEFLQTLQSVEKIEVLGYHNLGEFKWDNLGVNYPLKGHKTATPEDIKKAKTILGIK